MTSPASPPPKPGNSSALAPQRTSDPPWKGLAPYEQDLMTPEEGQAMLQRFLAAERKMAAYFRARKAAREAE